MQTLVSALLVFWPRGALVALYALPIVPICAFFVALGLAAISAPVLIGGYLLHWPVGTAWWLFVRWGAAIISVPLGIGICVGLAERAVGSVLDRNG